MPTVLRVQGFQFYFYSHETTEPPHIHVDKGGSSCKFWLSPVTLARNYGFSEVELNRIRDIVILKQTFLLSKWNEYLTAIKTDERVKDVKVTSDTLTVALCDGRAISVQLTWYPRLLKATDEARSDWKPCGGGYGIYWPVIDEHLSVDGLLRGAPSPELR